MLCQICKKNEANCYYKTNENGHVTEKYLCSECAAKSGADFGLDSMPFFPSALSDTGLLGSFLGSMFEQKQVNSGVCPSCGARLSEVFETGKLGCPDCYHTFRTALLPTLRKIHGEAKHIGKKKAVSAKEAKETKLSMLREKMKECVEKQEYEEAAKYRDEIKKLEEEK